MKEDTAFKKSLLKMTRRELCAFFAKLKPLSNLEERVLEQCGKHIGQYENPAEFILFIKTIENMGIKRCPVIEKYPTLGDLLKEDNAENILEDIKKYYCKRITRKLR